MEREYNEDIRKVTVLFTGFCVQRLQLNQFAVHSSYQKIAHYLFS